MTPASLRRKLLRCDVSSFAIEDVKAFRRVLPRQDEVGAASLFLYMATAKPTDGPPSYRLPCYSDMPGVKSLVRRTSYALSSLMCRYLTAASRHLFSHTSLTSLLPMFRTT